MVAAVAAVDPDPLTCRPRLEQAVGKMLGNEIV
jgi:hypothetical protein